MRKKWLWLVLVVVLILGLVFGLSRCKAKMEDMAQNLPLQPDSHSVSYGNIEVRIDITGELMPETIVSQKSRVSGKVVKLYVDENDKVKMGDILADIEPDYNQANTLFNTKASLERAELTLSKAQKDLQDKDLLFEKSYISLEEHTRAVDTLREAEIQYAQAYRQYEMIRDLDVPGKVVHMYATASGTVIKRNINEGEMVISSINSFGEGTVVMEIADLNKMIVKSNINEVDIAKFHLGQEGEISLDAFPYERFKGKISKIAPKAITVNNAKVFPVQISINASGEKARPGMTAAISLEGESRRNVLIIPIAAVFADDQNQDVVYLKPADKGEGKKEEPVPTPVRLGANDFQMVEVIEGLKEGDVVLLSEPGKKVEMQFMMQGSM